MSRFRNWLDKTFRPKPPEEKAPEESEDPVVIHWYAHNPHLDKLENHPRIGFEALQKAGETNGRMDHPGPEFQGLDGVESDVTEEFSKTWQGLLGIHGIAVSRWKETLTDLDPSILGSDQRTEGPIDEEAVSRAPIVVRACERMKNEIASAKAGINKAAALARDQKTQYENFKRLNQLDEDVKLRSWKTYAFWIALLLACISLEAWINGNFFAAQIRGGTWDTALQAFLISVVNVGLFGSLIMVCWRYKAHAKEASRVAAWIGLICTIPVALAFNFGAAHFRDAFPADHPALGDTCYREVAGAGSEVAARIPNISKEGLCLLGEDHVVLSGFDSYAFLALGLGFVVAGIIDWIHLFPGYPGLLKRRKLLAKAQEQLDARKEKLRSRLNSVRAGFIQELTSKHKESVSLIQQLADKHAELHNHSDELARRCRRHLTTYRASNRAFRQDLTTVPPHWSKEWKESWRIPGTPAGLDLSSRKVALWVARLDRTREARREYINVQYRDHLRYLDEITAVVAVETGEGA